MVTWAEKSLIEEKWNGITHAAGCGYFISALFNAKGESQLVYCAACVIVLILSTMYHATEETNKKNFLRMMDMSAIHVLIAASSVSYIRLLNPDSLAYLIPTCMCVIGVVHLVMRYDHREFTIVYVFFGLVGFLTFYFSIDNPISVWYFSVGVMIYLLGVVFYLRDYKKWYHTMWHLFVLAGMIVHFAGLNTI